MPQQNGCVLDVAGLMEASAKNEAQFKAFMNEDSEDIQIDERRLYVCGTVTTEASFKNLKVARLSLVGRRPAAILKYESVVAAVK